MSVLDLQYNFASLSLKELLAARDLYHYHLLSKANVVGTAIGLYLIRKDEEWPAKAGQGIAPRAKKTHARTLLNSEVRDYSWPCVLAFVRRWESEKAFGAGGKYDPSSIVPKTLYMEDGRAVPVCVVEVGDTLPAPANDEVEGPVPAFPLGGGCPIIVETQGVKRVATAGCLVTDGHTTYALTARHASGEAGERVRSILKEGEVEVGTSAGKQLTQKLFSDVYPSYPGRQSYCALDVGLVRIDRLDDWTANTYALPVPGPLADVHEGNLSLRLIDQPLFGFGAASGLLRGSLKALFYRHRSVGGFDYVADFMIAPQGEAQTRPGDSGMVWHIDVTPDIRVNDDVPVSKRLLRPLAVEWGGQVLGNEAMSATFAVATSLSTACRLLEVELVTDVGRGVSGYWGRTGHYSIAAMAISHIRDKKLKALMEANADILSFDLETIEDKGFDASVGQTSLKDKFVPLADVPDEIWKKLPKNRGGRTGGRDTSGGAQQSNGPEHPQHYADIDAPYGANGKSLRELCRDEPDEYLTLDAWVKYYADMSVAAKAAGDEQAATQYASKLKQGLLPFRLWQMFDAMSSCLKDGDVEGFVTAAGTAAHYMGDSSQPLHGSVLADGDKTRNGPRADSAGNPIPYGSGVHSAYETKMLSANAKDLLPRADKLLAKLTHSLPLCENGVQVARATIELMHLAAQALPPQEILDVFEDAGGNTHVATIATMYESLRDPTAMVLAQGARYLALLWDSAWKAGKGAKTAKGAPEALKPAAARKRYTDPKFIPSLTIDKIGAELQRSSPKASAWTSGE